MTHDVVGSSLNRRSFLALAAAGSAMAFIGKTDAQGTTPFNIQYDWLIDNGKLGDVVAQQKGFFAEEGLDVTFSPGGPNAQTVPPVLAGQAQTGQMGSNQVLAAYSEGIPLRIFATTYQNPPLVYVSLPRAPVRTPLDFAGKKVAVTPNGRWLLNLMLAVNKVDPATVELVTAGADLSPILLGQADVGVSFATNVGALEALGPDRIILTAADAGIHYYTGSYFTAADDYENRKDLLVRFTKAVSKGWGWAYENRREAVDILCDAYPNLNREAEYNAADTVLGLVFNNDTKTNGWGWVEEAKLQKTIDLFASGEAFKTRVPDLAGVFTREVLDLTADTRPKLG